MAVNKNKKFLILILVIFCIATLIFLAWVLLWPGPKTGVKYSGGSSKLPEVPKAIQKYVENESSTTVGVLNLKYRPVQAGGTLSAGGEKKIVPKTPEEAGLEVPVYPFPSIVSSGQAVSSTSTSTSSQANGQPMGGVFSSGQSEQSEFLERIQEAIDVVEQMMTGPVEEREVFPPDQIVVGASKQKIATDFNKEILVSFSDEEFQYFYPDYFIEDLKTAQNFIKTYDPSYQIIPEIKTDAQVRKIEETLITTLFYAGMLTKNEAERYITTVRFILPQFQLTELQNLRSQSKIQGHKNIFSKYFLPLGGLIAKLKKLVVPSAEAACGHCYIFPECFRSGPATPGGANTFTPYCYCTGCLYGQGCLDRCAPKPAIWDPTTGICGCG